jgi:predicted site-specific integrase-resolvase
MNSDELNLDAFIDIAQAVMLTSRGKSTIYRWIESGRLRTVSDAAGRQFVKVEDLLQVEASTKKGRPAGVPSFNRKGQQ